MCIAGYDCKKKNFIRYLWGSAPSSQNYKKTSSTKRAKPKKNTYDGQFSKKKH